MPYIINRYRVNDQEVITTVADGTINKTLDIDLVGKNYAGYGEVQNESFVHLLENFAGDVPPPKAISGQVWYDTTNQALKVCTGIVNNNRVWRSTVPVVSDTEPSEKFLGTQWIDTSTGNLKVYTIVGVSQGGGDILGWVTVGMGYLRRGEVTDAIPEILPVESGTGITSEEDVIVFRIRNVPVAVVSDTKFTPSISTDVSAQIPEVEKGLTLGTGRSLSFGDWSISDDTTGNLVFTAPDSLVGTAALVPSNDQFTLGSETAQWKMVYATAIEAQYADLAEKYLPDIEYEPGTVVMIGGEAEITAAKSSKRAIGAISTNPAYKMNKDLEGGQYVALKGRVPVKVIGPVVKGDELVPADFGIAVVGDGKVFAVALETNAFNGVKLVECLIL